MVATDIDPESRCRLPLPRRDELDPAAREVYDRLADPGGGTLRGLRGPGGITLHSPGLARHTRPLNTYLRYEAGLGGRVRELAILVTAREHDSQFEWAAHEAEARREGISADIIEIISTIAAGSGTGATTPANRCPTGCTACGWFGVTRAESSIRSSASGSTASHRECDWSRRPPE